MIAWLAMIVAKVASTPAAPGAAPDTARKNGLAPAATPPSNHRGRLSRIIEEQHREDKTIPGEADRPGTEVAHIGIERFGAGSAQEHRAEKPESR